MELSQVSMNVARARYASVYFLQRQIAKTCSKVDQEAYINHM